jgi:hypothetical protein
VTGRGDVLWPLLFGSTLTLVTTLAAQWFSLAFQTKRQREARRADFQRTTLIQLRDTLGQVFEVFERVMAARRALSERFERSSQDPDSWEEVLRTSLPEAELLNSLGYQVELLAAGLEHDPIRTWTDDIALWATFGPLRPSDQEAEESRQKLLNAQGEALRLLGEQLRRLP